MKNSELKSRHRLCDYLREFVMSTINLKDARTGFFSLIDATMKGEFITITSKLSVIPIHTH